MNLPPMDGITVVDFTRVLAGPLCTMLLSDLGADVIKVERPRQGDDTRAWGPPSVEQDATYFLSVNRGKRSIALDLSDDRESARDLIASADVVVENFRPGVMAKFGLDYESVKPLNPRLVYCSIPAFSGSQNTKPGYDLFMQAATGLMSLTGTDTPTKAGVAVLDVVTGLYASVGILAALSARRDTGQGQQVSVGLYESSLSTLVNQASAYLLAGVTPGLAGNAHPSIVPYQLFHAQDRPFVLAAGNDKLFALTVAAIGMPELADDPDYASNSQRITNRDALVAQLQAVFSTRAAAFWVDRLEAAGVPCSRVLDLHEVFSSPEAHAAIATVDDPVRGSLRYVRTPIKLTDTPLREPQMPPPHLDEHAEEIRHAIAAHRLSTLTARAHVPGRD